MAAKRNNINRSALDQGAITSVEHNVLAGAKKSVLVGPALTIVGTLGSARSVGIGASLWIYNNSATVGFVRVFAPGESASAPTGLADGIAVPPNSYIYLNTGTKMSIIGSAATLGCYLVQDDTRLNLDDNQG
jgi:hypothetical protein